MNADLWVIWISALILVAAIAAPIGSRYFPSQDVLDAEWRDGYEQGCDDEQRSSAPCEREHVRDEPRWDDTAENLSRLSARYYEPLSDAPGLITAVQSDTGTFCMSPIYDHLADQLAADQAARKLAPPSVLWEDGARLDPGPPLGGVLASHQSANQPGEPGSDPWERLAADLDDDPDISEWLTKADAARCSEIVRELRQLARTLEA